MPADPDEALRQHDAAVAEFDRQFSHDDEARVLLHEIMCSVIPEWDAGGGELTIESRVQERTPSSEPAWTAAWRAPDGWTGEGGPVRTPGKAAAATFRFRPPENGASFGRNTVEVTWTRGGNSDPVDVRRQAVVDVTTPRIWRVAGPFDNRENSGLVRELGPESGDDGPWSGMHGAVEWTMWPEQRCPLRNQAEPVFLDLHKAVDTNEWVVACAETYLHADQPTPSRFVIGSDDGCVIRLNGDEVFRHEERRAASPAQNTIETELAAGWNRIVVTLGQTVGGWGFYLQILDPEGNPLQGVVNRLPEPA
jgi:hypothetical protein